MKKKITSLTLTLLLGLFSWNATAQVAIHGATGIADGTSYTTLKGAFDAINTNASGLNTDNIQVRVSDNTTETATAVLNPSKGVNTLTTAAGSGYQAPIITIGGTKTGNFGTIITTITNGVITAITMSGGTLSAAANNTVTIAAPANGGTTATATAARGTTNLSFTITNGGTGYGPTATFSDGGGTGAAVEVKITTTATTLAGAGPWTATPATAGLTYTLTCPGSGYTSNPTCAISAFTGATAGTVSVASLYPSIEFSKLAIYPTVAGKTISGAVGLISIVGRTNVAIDGRVNRAGTPAVGSTDNLTLSCTHVTNPAVLFNSNAQNDTIQYCTLRGLTTTSPLGTVNFGTGASLANGNGLNVIDHNLFTITTGSATVPSYSIYAQGNSAFPNVGNKITNNEFKDVIAQYVASTNIYILGGVTSPQNDNYTISGNSFYNSTALADFAANNLAKVMIGIGASSAPFGGSHTITDNYIGGTTANCGGTKFIKTARETTLNVIQIYPSPSVSGGGATSIQNNTITNISWSNDYYPANMTGINIGGGTGDVNIGTETGNTIGDNTTNGSFTFIAKGAANSSATMINIVTTGTVNCQNNKIGSITGEHQTANQYVNITAISKSAIAGTTTISNNYIGSTNQPNSINTTTSGTATQTIYGINCQGTGINTVSNNIIANVTNNVSAVGNVYGINCQGTGNSTVENNTISKIKNTTTTGAIYAINMTATTGNVKRNFIHSNTITGASTALNLGIWCNGGTNTVSNNIVRLGDDNSYEIRAIGDGTSAVSTSMYHNTVYLSGIPTSLALSSASLYSSGVATIRNYKNNILVNARSNGTGSTSVHYAMNMAGNSGGAISVDGNDYLSTGTGAVLGRYNNINSSSAVIVTGQDVSSLNINPSFASAGGILATDYITTNTSLSGVTGTGISTDYAGTNRTANTIGAYFIPTIVTVPTGVVNSADLTLSGASQIEVAAGAELNLNSNPSISKIILAPTAKLSMGSNTITAPNGVVLQSDATGTATLVDSYATPTVSATVQQYLPQGRNWYVASPIESTTAPASANSLIGGGLATSVSYYNEVAGAWVNSYTGNLTRGVGYVAVSNSGNGTNNIELAGTLNSGDVAVTLTKTGAGSFAGYNLIANPYPSYINPMTAINANSNIEKTIWYRTKGSTYKFETVNTTSGVGTNTAGTGTVTGHIPPMQAFWVRTNANNQLFTFTNTMRQHAGNVVVGEGTVPTTTLKAKKQNNQLITRITVTSNAGSDEAVLYFNENAANGYDAYDSRKMFESATATTPEIFTSVDNQKLAINGLYNVSYDVEIPLGFIAKQTADFAISRTEMTNFAAGTRILLKDKLNPTTEFELAEGLSYNFSSQPTTASTDRFSLLFRAPGVATGIDNATKPNAQVFVNAANQITIIAPVKSNYAIYNAMGQQVTNGVTTSNYQTANTKLAAGMYIVKVGNNSTRVIAP